jgi:omega-amidase
MDDESLQLVAVQFDIAWEEPQENFRRVEQLLEGTSIRPGAMIVLPEMFATGFSMNVERTAQSGARESEQFLRDLARKHHAMVLGGVVGPPDVDGLASNEAVGFLPDGVELVRYRKLQPFTPAGEDVRYGFGTEHRLFTWNNMHVAPFICYDLRFPEVFRPAAVDGAELMIVIASWPCMRSEHWVRLLQARAIENQAYVVGLNRCGSDPQFEYDGRSAAFDPHGRLLIEADARSQVLQVEVNPSEVRTWRAQFPALRDIRQAARVSS